jgi:transcriptional regulator with XRE-family HTH domain
MTEPTPAKVAFSDRLGEICDDMKLPKRGRQTRLAKQFGVSQQAARKWLEAEGFPGTEMIIALAEWAQVNVNWLLQGAGPKTGNRVAGRVLVLDEAIHALTPEMRTDLIDNLRAKLTRIGKLTAEEPSARYRTMLDAYEHEEKTRKH